MANMKFEIANHPAQALHPFTKEPLVDDAGKPVPLIIDQRALLLDGKLIAYLLPKRKVSFIVPIERLGQAVADKAVEFANRFYDRNPSIFFPKEIPANAEVPDLEIEIEDEIEDGEESHE